MITSLRKSIRRIWVKDQGNSMVEAIVGTFLLSVALMSVGSVVVSVATQQRVSDILTQATNLAGQKVEEMHHLGYQSIQTAEEDFGEIDQFISYKRVTTVVPNASDTIKTIRVSVHHLGGQQVTLDTLIAR